MLILLAFLLFYKEVYLCQELLCLALLQYYKIKKNILIELKSIKVSEISLNE